MERELRALAAQLHNMIVEDSGLTERYDYWKGSTGAYKLTLARIEKILEVHGT